MDFLLKKQKQKNKKTKKEVSLTVPKEDLIFELLKINFSFI